MLSWKRVFYSFLSPWPIHPSTIFFSDPRLIKIWELKHTCHFSQHLLASDKELQYIHYEHIVDEYTITHWVTRLQHTIAHPGTNTFRKLANTILTKGRSTIKARCTKQKPLGQNWIVQTQIETQKNHIIAIKHCNLPACLLS